MPELLSVEDYLAGELASEVKHEYIDGVVHAMAGASNTHHEISVNALAFLASQLRGKPCKVYNSDTKIRIVFLNHVRFYYPDAMVVCERNPGTDSYQDRPVVVVEVLSESTRRTDLGEKRDVYLAIPSLKVLIFAERNFPAAISYRKTSAGRFETKRHHGLDASIPLPEIDAELPLAELHSEVDFPDC